jgi:hypothetical protein
MNPDTVVGIATSYGPDGPGIKSIRGQGIFASTNVSSPALGPTQLPIRWIREEKTPGFDVDYSARSSDEDNSKWGYTSLPSLRLHDVDREKFTFFYYISYDNKNY